MDAVTRIVAGPAMFWTAVVCVAGLLSVGLGLFWLFNKQARLRDLAELRKKLAELAPSDPEYGAVRALYTSMTIDAERWGFFHSDTSSGNHAGGADHGSSGGSDGGDH